MLHNGITLKPYVNALLLGCLFVIFPPVQASHHFESLLTQQNPEYDLTDLYVFESEKSGYTTFIVDINPTTGKDGVAKFGSNGVYSVHIASNPQMETGGLTVTAYLEGDQLVFGIASGANQAVGTKGEEVGRATVGEETTFNNGMRVWAGAARDPFVGNSGGIVAFRTKLAQGALDLASFNEGVDLFATLQSSIIVTEIPNDMLPPEIYVYATSAMYNVDTWVQVNRLANPLMTHLFMANNNLEIAEHVGHRPDTDNARAYAVSGMVLRAVSLDGKIADPVEYADAVAAKLLPDMIPYKTGTKAAYAYDSAKGRESINGRKPGDDAMDTALSIFMGRAVTDHANQFDRHPATFPYVTPVTGE
ncbi:DUF4331 domain-containing protein [Parasalinivibrio latis]|uniref:DUF4331 family protein n=1 Tax=Parasalinivibrio latis TaxID=2952610 RepID=UPI0030DF0BE5